MKTKLLAGVLLLLVVIPACTRNSESHSGPRTFSSFDTSSGTNLPAHTMRFVEVDLAQVLSIYQELSGRSIIRSPMLPMTTKITFDNATSLTRVEALQALDTILAANNVVMVCLGTKYVKAVTTKELPGETGPVVELPPDQLPDSSSFLVYVVKLKRLTPQNATSLLVPFAKLPNSIIGTRDSDLLILRDYSSNVRRMVQVLEETESNAKSDNPVLRLFHSVGETNSKAQSRNRN
ncbi:MAG TPA: hypothetical protein VK846_04115 [Candidatus Limnocylindria bacterium]|nr:hypothetical protein [Candidatus Limnocylindria bacterium]